MTSAPCMTPLRGCHALYLSISFRGSTLQRGRSSDAHRAHSTEERSTTTLVRYTALCMYTIVGEAPSGHCVRAERDCSFAGSEAQARPRAQLPAQLSSAAQRSGRNHARARYLSTVVLGRGRERSQRVMRYLQLRSHIFQQTAMIQGLSLYVHFVLIKSYIH